MTVNFGRFKRENPNCFPVAKIEKVRKYLLVLSRRTCNISLLITWEIIIDRMLSENFLKEFYMII